MKIELKQIDEINCQCLLAENPIWDHQLNVMSWIDIEAGTFYRYNLNDKQYKQYKLPHRIGSYGLTQKVDIIVAAFDIGIAFCNLKTKALEWLAQPESHLPYTRFNDGRVDTKGRFWAGTMVEPDKAPCDTEALEQGSLYCVEIDRQCKPILNDISISNGLCWSPDSKIMFHADSPHRRVTRYEFDEDTAQLSNACLYIDTTNKGFPDGSVCDRYGRYWHARWADSSVVCIDKDGTELTRIELPVTQVSSVAIGGPKMDLMFVTSASIGLDNEAQAKQVKAGNVFIFQLNESIGVKENICKIC
ncbi:SMP-30/gluconolactonase/LRE family protein [Glaciecola sp. KUL10]|uniref:SMP-30/gluconolactonase/LRE family protein n=1 Tax=Glaciecola sp. (strain KUL10) TaxID=2161813 RepID=UPI000D788359|nr:SMP-30/gluconolactonase/LRE family protein [Glaciecola sp. KUL10]GBL04519.1 SMP-30/Gluconolaconase/LRE-like region [Glaciecola sp. KUL10]